MKFEKILEGVKIDEGRSYDKYRKSNLEPKGSTWEKFALMFDIGVIDLDKFASLMGFDDFEDLDISIGPESLLKRDKKKFFTNLKESSIKANKMKDKEIEDTVLEYYS